VGARQEKINEEESRRQKTYRKENEVRGHKKKKTGEIKKKEKK